MPILRMPLPCWATRGQSSRVSIRLYDDATARTLLTATSGTVTIQQGSTALVSAAAVKVDVATLTAYYDWTPATDLPIGPGYTVIWSLIVATETYTYRHEAEVVIFRWGQIITEADLEERHSDIRTVLQNSSFTDFSGPLNQAHVEIVALIRKQDRYPYLVMSPSDLYLAAQFKALEILFVDAGLSATPQQGWMAAGELYGKKYDNEVSNLTYKYDTGAQGYADVSLSDQSNTMRGIGLASSSISTRWPR